ncbi:hypothetical protein CLV79_11925 [Limimaricola soesokkakensis]|uniref:Uncharacterized protein n=1 Tax=Limimaricola soesokkakensis TaxID=1343159 RepID=A0A1X7A3R0_9RHOB|nr:hydrolase [Limimaricola soesokkakensis]PSK80838.1 hypothetical protein CLV79_11925 [Limimaricola soesokkakensis]SLN69770.1 hypothetical protein LOS8367_03513 [Limimaricola soesokkakensis]
METNALPRYDDSDNPTGCCPRFNPEGWDGAKLHFEDKNFVRATTTAMMHVPLNMGRVFERVQKHIDAAQARDANDFIVLSRDLSPWSAEHLFAISGPVPNEESVTLSGDFVTKVFEGPYRDAGNWYHEMRELAGKTGDEDDDIYFFYTTCPKCAKAYGENYVVGVARTS